MRLRTALAALLALFLMGLGLPGYAAPADTHGLPKAKLDRLHRLDRKVPKKLATLPAGLRRDKTVSALVEIEGDPVSVQVRRRQTTRGAALARVRAQQSSIDPLLRAAGAKPYGQVRTVLNAVQVRVQVADLDKVAAVAGVKHVQVSKLVHLDNTAAERFTGVDQTWDTGFTGKGTVIGVIDSGIDYTHADFGGPGTPAAYSANNRTTIEAGTFPTLKVTGGYDFVGDDYDAASDDPQKSVPKPDADPLDCDGHGTHVAGTAAGSGVAAGQPYAGPYTAAALDTPFNVQPGVAPEATLKAYKVFGCDGSMGDDVVVAAIDRAVADGVDVINLSLGSDYATTDNLETTAITNATRAGVLVVAAAGNAGSASYIVGDPASADAALAVAAVDAEFQTLPGVTFRGAVRGEGINANEADIPKPITGTLVDVDLGCEASDYAGVAGKIALTTRGACDRTDRAKLGQQAGALAVIMVNDAEGLPPVEGPIPGVTIPFIGAYGEDADAFYAADGKTVTIAKSAGITNPAYGSAADFSSNGPRRTDSAQKPDIAAPGVSIPSAAFGTGTGFLRESGTSMASPHVAGVAALVAQAHPTWTGAQLKAALMSTADPDALGDYDSQPEGTGLVDPLAATKTRTYAATSTGLNSLKFGVNHLGKAYAESKSFTISNTTKTSVTYGLSTQVSTDPLGASFAISPKSVTLKAGQTRTIKVTIRLSTSDVVNLPPASLSDGGDLVSLHGLIVAKPKKAAAAAPPLRLSFLWVPIGISDVHAYTSVTASAAGQRLLVNNRGIHQGDAEIYSWLLADPTGDAGSSLDPDVTDVGVQSFAGDDFGFGESDRVLFFSMSMARGTATAGIWDLELSVDVSRDGKDDFVVYTADAGLVTEGVPDGTVATFVVDLSNDDIIDAWPAFAPANGSTVEMVALASDFGLVPDSGPVDISAAGFNIIEDSDGDEVDGTATFDPYQPVLGEGSFASLAGGKRQYVPVDVDADQLAIQTHPGWLVVCLDDQAGTETDRVKLVVPGEAAGTTVRR